MTCPTDPEDWKKIEERFETRWNVPHTLGAPDWKHIALEKPKKREFYKYNDSFSHVLLALVDTDYRFLWEGVGSSGSSSDVQKFNHSKLRKNIEDGTLELPPLEALGKEDHIATICCWVTAPSP